MSKNNNKKPTFIKEAPAPEVAALSKEKRRLLTLDTTEILNKEKRKGVFAKQKRIKLDLKSEGKKRKLREISILGIDDAPVKQKPRTIENTTEENHTVVLTGDEEVEGEEAMDEYAKYYKGEVRPKICITTCIQPSRRVYDFIKELLYVFPKSYFYPRKGFTMKKITEDCIENGFTDILVINEDNKKINGMTVCHLPDGPTAYFQLRNVRLHKEMGKGEVGELEQVSNPEVLLNRFTSRIGKRCARVLGSLFQIKPHFHSRRVVTFHNQRDYIFFRQHRYIFERAGKAEHANDEESKKATERARLQAKINKFNKTKGSKNTTPSSVAGLLDDESIINKTKVRCTIEEIGPQFTMKLKWIQHGTFDYQQGEYEWKHNNDMKTHKKKFHL